MTGCSTSAVQGAPTPPRRTRVLLDTNVWGYLADACAVDALRKVARGSAEILACPAVAIELLATNAPSARKARLDAITRSCWTRLMPEAFTSAEEFLGEVRRLRPQWLDPSRDLSPWYALQSDWRGNWWGRMRRRPNQEAEAIALLGGDDRLHEARRQAEEERTARHALHLDGVKPDAHKSRIVERVPGWMDVEFDAWRGEALNVWAAALLGQSSIKPYLEWVEPWIDPRAPIASRLDWVQFWVHDVEAGAMPSHVLRSHLALAQSATRTSSGTPGDNQIGTYLLAADLFVTGDKGFSRVVEHLRRTTELALPEVALVPAGQAGVERLLSALAT